MKHTKWILLIGFLMTGYVGCNLAKSENAASAESSLDQRHCHQMLKEFDKAVQKAGVEDVQDARIDGYPCFRIDRFLYSFKNELTDENMRREWIKRAGRLGMEGQADEIYNLPDTSFQQLFQAESKNKAVEGIRQCSESLETVALNDHQVLNDVIEKAEIPSDYRTYARVVGGYPVSRWFILRGLKDLQIQAKEKFQDKEALMDHRGNWYYPKGQRPDFPKQKRMELLNRAVQKSALAIPEPEQDILTIFFDYFEPVWHVLPQTGSDQIGGPYWKTPHEIDIDVSDPVVYRFHSFTRMNRKILLQLNYVVWFPKRSSKGFFDIYSGHIDGLIWRVTLDTDGSVLLYDSIHPCGCYHKYYPVSKRLSPLQHPPTAEPPLILDTDIPDGESARVTVHLSGREHYVIGLSPATEIRQKAIYIRNERYDRLRSLPLGGGFKSMFDEEGMVEGSERKERFLVWSTGVLSAGAMRQRGHHAMALVGNLYFDEPRLFEKVFQIK